MLFKQTHFRPWLFLDVLHKNIIHINGDRAHPAPSDRTNGSFFFLTSGQECGHGSLCAAKSVLILSFHGGCHFSLVIRK